MANISSNLRKYVLSAATIGIMLVFPLLPNIGQITDCGMRILGITLGMLFGWIFVDLTWPSILSLILLGTSGLLDTTTVFTNGFSNTVIVSSILFFAFAKMLEELQVSNFIASSLLTQKALMGRPWLIISTILATAFIISILCDSFAAIFLTWSFALAITDLSGYKRGESLISFLICGIVYVSCLGGLVVTFKPIPMAFMGFFNAATGINIDMAKFAIFMFVIGLTCSVVLLLVGRFILRLDVSKLSINPEDIQTYKIENSIQPKLGLCMMLALIAMLLFPSFMPASWGITALLKTYGTYGCISVFLIIPAIIQNKEGKPLISIGKMMEGINWDIIWLLMAIMIVASCVNNAETGIMATVGAAIVPSLQGISPTLFLVVATLLVAVVTQVASNLIVGAIFVPLIVPLYMSIGGDAIICFLTLYCGLQASYATPAASATAGLMYGNENVSTKHAYLYGISLTLIMLLVGFVVGIPFAKILF